MSQQIVRNIKALKILQFPNPFGHYSLNLVI